MAGGTEPYVLKVWQEGLHQLQGGDAGYLEVFVLEHMREHGEAHPDNLCICIGQLLHQVLIEAAYSSGLCARPGCAVNP